MRLVGNILWFLLCGLLLAILWFVFGLLWCVTIIGLPVGLQCFKFAQLSLWPFGREVVYGPSLVSLIINVLWIVFGGLEICIAALLIGGLLCLTIVGIPFGLQCFKIATLALMPFGAKVVRIS